MPEIIKNGILYHIDPSVIGASGLEVTTPEVQVTASTEPFRIKQLQYALAHAYGPTQQERIQMNKRNANIAQQYFDQTPTIGNIVKGAYYWLKSKPYLLGEFESKNNHITGTAPTPSFNKLSIREALGLSKGVYNGLNKFQKEALKDYEQYVRSGQYRNKFLFNTKTNTYRYDNSLQEGDVSAVRQLVSQPGAVIRESYIRTPDGALAYFPKINQSRVGFTPKGYNFGELRATPEQNGLQKSIVLTSPRVDFADAMVDVTPEQLAKLPNRVPKDDMKRFWSTLEQTTKPGTYLSGDAGHMPLGGYMIKASTPSQVTKILIADNVDKANLIRTGLSPDSYKAIIKQGLRKGHSLRFSRDSFTKLNSSAVDNQHLYTQWKNATTPYLKQQFVQDWNEQIYPNTAYINDKGVIQFLQPFSFYKKNGGVL